MINHEQILFFHLRVMESKIDNSPKETNSMKTKNKHFTVFLSFMCLKGAAKCERQSTNHPPKAITTSKHLSNSILKLQRCYHWQQTHNNHKLWFLLGSEGRVFSLWLKKNSDLKKVCHNFPVCWKKLPNFQEIILGGCCVGGQNLPHFNTLCFSFEANFHQFSTIFFCLLMLNLVYDVWDISLVLHQKNCTK